MALATLSVDLVALTSKFEAGIRGGTQTATTGQTDLTRGEGAFLRSLQRQAQQTPLFPSEYQASLPTLNQLNLPQDLRSKPLIVLRI